MIFKSDALLIIGRISLICQDAISTNGDVDEEGMLADREARSGNTIVAENKHGLSQGCSCGRGGQGHG